MNSKPENLNNTLKALVASIEFIDNEITQKMPQILGKHSIPAINGFHTDHRLDNLFMSFYIYKNNVLSIYECFEKCLNAFDLSDIPNVDHATAITIKHRRLTVADTIRSLIENMIKVPEFEKLAKDEKFVKGQYMVYIDLVNKMHAIDVAINNYFDKNLTNVKGLSDFPSFIDIYTNDISKDTHSSTFTKFGQILIKSTFDPNTFYPVKK